MNVLRTLAVVTASSALFACANVKEDVKKEVEVMRVGPEAAPQRNITNFAEGLRCMDNLMITYGARDIVALVEDLTDNTKKISAGNRDMLISAVSDMTKRSRAIRLIAFGTDSGNLVSFLAAAERKNVYSTIPEYDIRGSISQLDESVARKQADFGIGLEPFFGVGKSNTASASVLGLDLSIIRTSDMSVIPGVTSRNAVSINKEGSAIDGDATIKKFGVNFSMLLSKNEGSAQALRNLIELAAIELFGRLLKIPYWTCLGIDSNSQVVQDEIGDWFYSMTANQELVAYMQNQLRLRGFYNGPLDGKGNPQFSAAVAKYKSQLGLPANSNLDLPFFSAFLNTSSKGTALAEPAKASRPQAPAPVATTTSNQPVPVSVSAMNNAKKFKPGETLNLLVKPASDAYVYCYYRDDGQKIQRFFPNRFYKDAKVSGDAGLQIPGEMRFKLAASSKGLKETVACFSTPRDVIMDLPPNIRSTDFENLNVTSIEQVKSAFASVAGSSLGEGYFNVEVR